MYYAYIKYLKHASIWCNDEQIASKMHYDDSKKTTLHDITYFCTLWKHEFSQMETFKCCGIINIKPHFKTTLQSKQTLKQARKKATFSLPNNET